MKVVIIGLGIQGKKRLAVAGAEVVATVDPVVAAAAHQTIEDVPQDAYDASIVCTPDQQKLPIINYLLRHGKHVLVEKPLVADRPEDLKRLLELAKTKRTTCWTAYNHRYEPSLVKLRGILASGILGKVYHARFFYGNGTAADVRRSPWRDEGLGVILDLGSHLLDMTDFLFGLRPARLESWTGHRFENRSYDYGILAAPGTPTLQYEMTLLSWRNTFSVDVLAEKGSAHVQGLCKWGASSLTVRHRVLPSGRPTEEVEIVERPDPTWELEYNDFKQHCRRWATNLNKDLWINGLLQDLQAQSKEAA